MTDKEIALELTESYLDHLNNQMNNKHSHTDLDFKGVANTYKGFYNLVSKIDEGE